LRRVGLIIPTLKKTCFYAILAALALTAAPLPVLAVEPEDAELDLSFFERYWQEIEKEAGEILPPVNWRNFWESLRSGETLINPGRLFSGAGRYFFGELLLQLKIMGQLLVLAVAAAFLKNIESAFQREQVATLTRSIVLIVLIGISVQVFHAAITSAARVINDMVDFALALLPTIIVLLASLGSFVSSAMLHPLVVFGINFFGSLIRAVILPLIYLSTVLGLANHFSPSFQVGKLADLFRDLCGWGLGLTMTLFVGILTVQGAAGTVADAVSLRTAKYMTGAFVPVVGKMLSDAVETVMGASLLLKNGIYLGGIVVLFLLALFPLLKLAAVILVYKVSAALVQPLGDTGLAEGINTMAGCLTMVLATMASVTLIFILAVTVVVGAGNAALMYR